MRSTAVRPCFFARAVRNALGQLPVAGVALAPLVCSASTARAEQFTLTDTTWTHSATTTSDSHYRVKPSAETPKNLTSPVDYAQGSVHMVLDVKTKPDGGTPTDFQVCMEGAPAYVCADISPSYTSSGRVIWSTPVSRFYRGNDQGIDYSMPIKQVALILKDTHNGKPQGDVRFVPTDLHVEVVWLSPGATYTKPAPAGTKDAGVDAGRPDAGASGSPAADASLSRFDAALAAPPRSDANRAPVADAALASRDAGSARDPASAPARDDDSGCSLASHTPSSGSLGVLAVLALCWRRRRRLHS